MDYSELTHARFSLMPIPRPVKTPQGEWFYDGKTPYKKIPWRQFISNPLPYEKLDAHFRENPDDNIAILTGRASRLLVVDIDRKTASQEDFNKAVEKIANLYDAPPPRVLTGGGGVHLYTAYAPVKNTLGIPFNTLFPSDPPSPIAIDVKSDAGYVIAPPSLHKSGTHYIFHPAYPLEDAPFPSLPSPILNLVNVKSGRKTVEDWRALMSSSSQGTRHRDAVSVTGLLLIRFQPQEWETLAWPALKGWNHFVAKPPLDEKELRSIFTSLADKEYEKYKI